MENSTQDAAQAASPEWTKPELIDLGNAQEVSNLLGVGIDSVGSHS